MVCCTSMSQVTHLKLIHSPFLLYISAPSVSQFSSVTQSCLTLCNPMDCSTSTFPVLPHLPQLAQTHILELVIPPNHVILCHLLLLLPSVFPSIKVFSKESALWVKGPKYWSFIFSIDPSNEYSGLISLTWTCWIYLQSKGLSKVFSNTTVHKHQFFSAQLSWWSSSHIHTWLLEKL